MNAYGLKALKDMGINVAVLGCVMLDVEKIKTESVVPADWAYISANPERYWIKGLNAGDHITLLYGLLSNANTIRHAVDEVLDGWDPGDLSIESVGSFPSTFADEPYACIVAHISVTPALLDAHARLSLLPHIDTFWEYKPHLTLGYVKRDREQEAVAAFGTQVSGAPLYPLGLNYGRAASASAAGRDDRQENAPPSRVPTVTAADTEATTTDETPAHALHVLDATGDTRTIWNPEIQDEVDAAKATFRKLKDKGYLAYRVDAEGEQGEVISTFDPKAGKIIMTRPYTGG